MLGGYDPNDPTITISPDGYRFKWINKVGYLIDAQGLTGVYDDYLYQQMMASFPNVVDVYGNPLQPTYTACGGSAENPQACESYFEGYTQINAPIWSSDGTSYVQSNVWSPAADLPTPVLIYAPNSLLQTNGPVDSYAYGDPIAAFGLTNVPLPTEQPTENAMAQFTNAQVVEAVKASMAQGFTFQQSQWGAQTKYGITDAQWNSIDWPSVIPNLYPGNQPATVVQPNTTVIDPVLVAEESDPGFFEGVSPGMLIAAGIALFTLFK